MTPRLGPVQARRLLAAFGSPDKVWAATPSAWRAVVPRLDVGLLSQVPPELPAQLDRTLAWLAERTDAGVERAVLTWADPRYPAALLEAGDPPPVLFAQGRLSLLNAPAVAIVGSRHPTPQGEDHARAFARALAQAGLVVVSGLALGIDAAAHEGALEGGHTIAVLGTGLQHIYPKAHGPLARRIAASGLLLSEFLLDAPPLQAHFPRRNRIVAALSQGTLVVEAALQSGSLITARLAAEMGREVMAMPGSLHSPQSRGCHALIKQGAKLVETAQDVLDELRWGGASASASGAAGMDATASGGHGMGTQPDPHTGSFTESDPVLRAMGHDPVGTDALCARTGLSPADLSARLLELELLGQVARLPGALFQRVARA